MKKNLIFIGLLVFFVGFSFILLPAKSSFAAECQARINFDAKPNPAPANQNVEFRAFVTLSGLGQSGDPNEGFCTKGGTPVKAISVRFYAGVARSLYKTTTLEASNSGPYAVYFDFKPSDFNLQPGQSFTVYAVVFPSPGTSSLVSSSSIKVNVIQGAYGSFACVANDGKYACATNRYCSDAVGCTAEQKAACRQISDSSQCGQIAPSTATHKACNAAKICVNVPGAGSDACNTDADCTGASNAGTGRYIFNLPNPIGVENFQDLINILGVWIFNLAIPIAVIVIIYAGVLMLTAGGNPAKFKKGAEALKYAVLGLAVVLIGKGFVTLIQSILSLRE